MSSAIRRAGFVALSAAAGLVGLGSTAAQAATANYASTGPTSASNATNLSMQDEASVLGGLAIKPTTELVKPGCTAGGRCTT
jgi:hypothetical protein